jgi:hypothetical protein
MIHRLHHRAVRTIPFLTPRLVTLVLPFTVVSPSAQRSAIRWNSMPRTGPASCSTKNPAVLMISSASRMAPEPM